MSLQNAIDFDHVSKSFRTDFWKPTRHALTDVSFSVKEGETFGLIGPNGAGKTTSIKILLGLIRPSAGSVKVWGHSILGTRYKSQIGYLPENAYYYDYLTPKEILHFYGGLFGMTSGEREKKADQLLEWVGLTERKNDRIKGFSKGMTQRVGIAQALINDPKLVILDEPMSGLDPIGRKEVRDIILRLAQEGKTILMSSHILSDVEAVCASVAIIIRGKMRAFGMLHDLIAPKTKDTEIVFRNLKNPKLPEAWKESVTMHASDHRVLLRSSQTSLIPKILEWGENEGGELDAVFSHRESLEDLFLRKLGDNE